MAKKKKGDGVFRERWKNKYVIVARSKGRIQSWKKWSPKFKLDQARNIFGRTNTFDPLRFRERRVTVNQYIDYRKKSVSKKIGKYQVIARATFSGGTIFACSSQKPYNYPYSKMKEEAKENLYARVGNEFGEAYEVGAGAEVIDRQRPAISFGVQYFK